MKKFIVAAITLFVLFVVGAYAATPGTEADPLVTKSYIQNVVYTHIDNMSKFSVVEVNARKSVICGAGTEVIVRAGDATIIANKQGGVSDVTRGADLQNAEEAPLNHLLVIPRNDTRGIWTVSKCTLMIKGEYSVK